MKPFIRQVGGKRQLADRILALIPARPFGGYLEPFLGGGAVWCALHTAGRLPNHNVVLGDADAELMSLWRAVKADPDRLLLDMDRLAAARADDPKALHAELRNEWNNYTQLRTPARYWLLRRLGFNGLWRLNAKGENNVGWRKTPPTSIDVPNLHTVSRALAHVRFGGDFTTHTVPKRDTLVYLDPPYDGDWNDYTAKGWSWSDFRFVVDTAAAWHARGACVVLSHADNDQARSLIAELWPTGVVHVLSARRLVNRDGAGRGLVSELLVIGS